MPAQRRRSGLDEYREGEWNLICDRSGRKIKASEARREWNGLIVHESEYEERHPQDYVRGRPDRQAVPFTRPEPPDTFRP